MKLTPLLLLLALSARADIVFLGPPIVYGDVSVAQSADSVTASAYPWGGSGLAYLSYSLAEQVQVTTAGDYTLTDTVTISGQADSWTGDGRGPYGASLSYIGGASLAGFSTMDSASATAQPTPTPPSIAAILPPLYAFGNDELSASDTSSVTFALDPGTYTLYQYMEDAYVSGPADANMQVQFTSSLTNPAPVPEPSLRMLLAAVLLLGVGVAAQRKLRRER